MGLKSERVWGWFKNNESLDSKLTYLFLHLRSKLGAIIEPTLWGYF